jgi:hypothetical protein
MTPNGARVTAPTPLVDVTSKNFSHSALLMSEGTSTFTSACSNARRVSTAMRNTRAEVLNPSETLPEN